MRIGTGPWGRNRPGTPWLESRQKLRKSLPVVRTLLRVLELVLRLGYLVTWLAMKISVSVALEQEVLARLEVARGVESRSSWVGRVVEEALGDEMAGSVADSGHSGSGSPPDGRLAPPRPSGRSMPSRDEWASMSDQERGAWRA